MIKTDIDCVSSATSEYGSIISRRTQSIFFCYCFSRCLLNDECSDIPSVITVTHTAVVPSSEMRRRLVYKPHLLQLRVEASTASVAGLSCPVLLSMKKRLPVAPDAATCQKQKLRLFVTTANVTSMAVATCFGWKVRAPRPGQALGAGSAPGVFSDQEHC